MYHVGRVLLEITEDEFNEIYQSWKLNYSKDDINIMMSQSIADPFTTYRIINNVTGTTISKLKKAFVFTESTYYVWVI